MNLTSLIVALIVAYIAYLITGLLLPAPFPLIVALLVFVAMAFGERLAYADDHS